MVAVAEWVVAGEAAWVADVGTSERVAVRAVARLVARIVVGRDGTERSDDLQVRQGDISEGLR